MSHFGVEFVELLKKDGLHGSFFQYDEYLELANCERGEDFRELLDDTEFAKTEVTEDVVETYRNFSKEVESVHRKQILLSFVFMGLSRPIPFLVNTPLLGDAIFFLYRKIIKGDSTEDMVKSGTKNSKLN